MRKFKLDSIFSRSSDDREKPQRKETGGVLAVWGSPGSGKTTVAVKLAKYLADKKKNVALVLCDMTAPMLPCICPSSELECTRSLGSILAAAHVTAPLIKNNCVTHKRIPHITILGMQRGENEYSYPPCSQQQVSELISELRELAPYVIIDCGSYIASDILSAVSLMQSDSVVQLSNCNLKSASYFLSQLKTLKEHDWDEDKLYGVISDVRPEQSAENMKSIIGSAAFTLPHSDELAEQYLAGNLFADLCLKDSRPFRKEIEKICKEVFGV